MPVSVKKGDIVTYTIRVYNEGELDGYVGEITDHLPEYLEYVDCDINKTTYKWTVSNDGRTVTTDYLKDTKLEALRALYGGLADPVTGESKVQTLIDELKEILSNDELLLRLSDNSKEFSNQFIAENILEKWEEVFEKIDRNE